MKIFLSFLQGKLNHSIPAYSFWEYYIKNGIEEAGHTWVECSEVDWAEGLVPKSNAEQETWRAKAWEKTLAYLKNTKVDVFLSYLYPQQIDVSSIKELKGFGIPTINFFCDHVREFSTLPAEFSVFDLNWVPEKMALEMYRKAGLRFCYAPMPMWIDPKFRIPETNHNNRQVSFVGSKDIQRQLLFEKVLSDDPLFPLKIYGSGWQEEGNGVQDFAAQSLKDKIFNQYHFISKFGIRGFLRKTQQRNLSPVYSKQLQNSIGEKPDFEQYIALTRRSTITVGVNRFPSFKYPLNTPQTYSRLRDIEAPMLGACYLTEYAPGMEDLYDINTDIMVYYGPSDFLEKAKEIIKNPLLQSQLRNKGQQTALNSLNISKSLEKIFDVL